MRGSNERCYSLLSWGNLSGFLDALVTREYNEFVANGTFLVTMKEDRTLAESKSYVNRRLHSLLGVIPVGAFLVVHLVTNYYSTMGEEAFLKQVEFLESLPFLIVLEFVLIYIPILFHGIYGLYIAFQAKNNLTQYGTFRNYMFMLQRVTGVITFIFIIWHVWQTRMQVFFGNIEPLDFGRQMHEIFSNPVWLVLYLISLVAAIFHFSNGLWSFLVSWGITVGPRAQRVATYVCGVIFVLMMIIGVRAIFGFLDPEFATISSTLLSTL